MKERPIIFSGESVRAILAGRKTQTRRIVKPCRELLFGAELSPSEIAGEVNAGESVSVPLPYGWRGDRLWIREAFSPSYFDDGSPAFRADFDGYRLRGLVSAPKWKPSIHLPRRLARIVLEVVAVRVEKLQEITEADAKAEGARIGVGVPDHRVAFGRVWEAINGRGSWAANPWVWVVEFRRAEP